MASRPDPTTDPDPKAHCHDRTSAKDYRPPRDDQLDNLDLCGFCFPDGEIDVDETELLVTTIHRPRNRIHRKADSDGSDWSYDVEPDHDLSRALQRGNVTSIDELQDELGGDA